MLYSSTSDSSPTSFVQEQIVQTMSGGKTLTLDRATDHILVIAAETAPPATPPPAGGPGGRGQMAPGSFSMLVVGK
jgi:hypothetical protein